MNLKTVRGLSMARKILASIQKSPLLRRKTAKELRQAFALIRAWETTQGLKRYSLAQLKKLLELAAGWNASAVLGKTAPRVFDGYVKLVREYDKNSTLKGKTRRDIESAFKTLEKWKTSRQTGTPPRDVQAAMTLRKEWDASQERRKLGPGGMENAVRAVREWEKLGGGKAYAPQQVAEALQARKAWDAAPALKGKSIKELESAQLLAEEWNKSPDLKGHSPDILDTDILLAMGAVGEKGPYYYLPDSEICALVHSIVDSEGMVQRFLEAERLTRAREVEHGGWIVEEQPGRYAVPGFIAGEERSIFLGDRPHNAIAMFHVHYSSSDYSWPDRDSISSYYGKVAFSMVIGSSGKAMILNPKGDEIPCGDISANWPQSGGI